MSKTTIATLKFVGTISLGLLTGVSYTLTTIALPPLLALPSASSAHSAFLRLQALSKRHLRALSYLALSSFALAFALSPRRGRHPYLLWTGATVLLSRGVDYALRADENQVDGNDAGNGRGSGSGHASSRGDGGSEGSVSDEEANMGFERVGRESPVGGLAGQQQGEEEVNGEEVRSAMERVRFAEMVRTAVSGVGFAMGVVGIWGDGF